jgi:hypothetical protein
MINEGIEKCRAQEKSNSTVKIEDSSQGLTDIILVTCSPLIRVRHDGSDPKAVCIVQDQERG